VYDATTPAAASYWLKLTTGFERPLPARNVTRGPGDTATRLAWLPAGGRVLLVVPSAGPPGDSDSVTVSEAGVTVVATK
jgi:hypothetical protein